MAAVSGVTATILPRRQNHNPLPYYRLHLSKSKALGTTEPRETCAGISHNYHHLVHELSLGWLVGWLVPSS